MVDLGLGCVSPEVTGRADDPLGPSLSKNWPRPPFGLEWVSAGPQERVSPRLMFLTFCFCYFGQNKAGGQERGGAG